MSPLVCFVFAVSLAIVPTTESASLDHREAVESEELSVSELLERANQNSAAHGDVKRSRARNANPCTASGCKWPKSKDGFVKVHVSISSAYTTEQRNIIIDALLTFQKVTCIRFYWWQGERNYIYFFPGKGCWSYVGRQDGRQRVSLEANGCLYLGVVQHEVLHALGFHHEQVRSDRNRYVKILFENVQPGLEHNFKIQPTNNLGTLYDFNSVMQYSNKAFSKNGKDTIVAISDPNLRIGKATEMNKNDITRVNKLYQCGCVRARRDAKKPEENFNF